MRLRSRLGRACAEALAAEGVQLVKELAFVRVARQGVEVVIGNIFQKLDGLIESAKERGEVAADVDSGLLSGNLFALYFTFLLLWLGSGDSSPDARRPSLRQMIELQLKGAIGPDLSKSLRG